MAKTDPKTIAPFTPQLLRRQLLLDSGGRWSMLIAALAVILGPSIVPGVDAFVWNGLLLALAIAWVVTSTISARVAHQLPAMGSMIEQNPEAAQQQLATFIHRRMLQRPVRLMVYQQLATLRHRQERFAEAAAICQSVLEELPVNANLNAMQAPGTEGVNQHGRAQLLLLLTEARLHCRDLPGAYIALTALHQCKLTLVETLQRLALQTHYEIAAGYDANALSSINSKISYAELMPAPQCGAVHAMLAIAAGRSDQPRLADWLRQRATLLCTPEQFEHFMRTFMGTPPAPVDAAVGQLV